MSSSTTLIWTLLAALVVFAIWYSSERNGQAATVTVQPRQLCCDPATQYCLPDEPRCNVQQQPRQTCCDPATQYCQPNEPRCNPTQRQTEPCCDPSVIDCDPSVDRICPETTMIRVKHDDPLLVSLFSKQVQVLPEGVSQEQFDRLVDDHVKRYLKAPPVQKPRGLDFNYDKYTAEEERAERDLTNHTKHFVNRAEFGSLSEQVARGELTGKLQVKRFAKKKLKR